MWSAPWEKIPNAQTLPGWGMVREAVVMQSCDFQVMWLAGHVTSRSCDLQVMWLAGHVTHRSCNSQVIWLTGHLTCRLCDLQVMWLTGYVTCRSCDLQGRSFDLQVVWLASCVTCKLCDLQVIWLAGSGHVTCRLWSCDLQVVWLALRLNEGTATYNIINASPDIGMDLTMAVSTLCSWVQNIISHKAHHSTSFWINTCRVWIAQRRHGSSLLDTGWVELYLKE